MKVRNSSTPLPRYITRALYRLSKPYKIAVYHDKKMNHVGYADTVADAIAMRNAYCAEHGIEVLEKLDIR